MQQLWLYYRALLITTGRSLGAMIAHIIAPVVVAFLGGWFYVKEELKRSTVETESRCDRMITGISTLWRRAIGTLCRKHTEETVIEQF